MAVLAAAAVVVVVVVVVAAAAVVVVTFRVVEALDDALTVVPLSVVVVVGVAEDLPLGEGDSFFASDCVTLGACVVAGFFWLLELLPAVGFVVVYVTLFAFCFLSTLSQGQALVLCLESMTPGSDSKPSDFALRALGFAVVVVGELAVFDFETVVLESFVALDSVDLD